MRRLLVTVGLTVEDDAIDEAVTDFVFDLVCEGGVENDLDQIPYISCDDSEWERVER